MSKKILFQFPGQGSQAVGMGTSLADAHPEARAVFDEVNAALGEDLFAMMKDGPEEDLRLTRNAQPALFAASNKSSVLIDFCITILLPFPSLHLPA